MSQAIPRLRSLVSPCTRSDQDSHASRKRRELCCALSGKKTLMWFFCAALLLALGISAVALAANQSTCCIILSSGGGTRDAQCAGYSATCYNAYGCGVAPNPTFCNQGIDDVTTTFAIVGCQDIPNNYYKCLPAGAQTIYSCYYDITWTHCLTQVGWMDAYCSLEHCNHYVNMYNCHSTDDEGG